ncbi:MAG: Fe(3+) ABC transporter substrate-binding protein [Alphaproteobacteria bacterium]|nr:Fe(3+) ABC transporter substrate-binding protein [Alphaproteobacteria bacterium]
MKPIVKKAALAGLVITGIAAASAMAAEEASLKAGEVNVYSYRQPFLVQPLFDAFTEQTGVKVNVLFAKTGLVERLKQEGANSPADVIFTVDIGRLSDVYEAELTQSVASPALAAAIPDIYREPEGHWYGLTRRARIIYASKDRISAEEAPKTYEELADPKWRGRICTRSGNHVYQVGLTAAMVAHHGEAKTEAWLRGIKANLARKPQGNDRAQVKAIREGECDIALGNHYYYVLMQQNEEQSAWAQSVYPVFPTVGGSGTHVNISGMALTKASPNQDNGVKLMEFLAGPLAQQMYAEQNYEYPILEGVPETGVLKAMGPMTSDTLPLADISRQRSAAIKLVDKVGYND